MEIARSEAVEADLDRLIERRARKGEEDPEEQEELWKESVRRYTARRREEMRAAWCEHHQGQAARLRTTLEALIANHEEQAERYRNQPRGEMRMNHTRTTLGHQGLPYGTPAAEEMISDRMKKLAEKGQPADRQVAVEQLAAEGELRTLGEATTRSVSLAEAGRKESAEERRARDWLARAKEEAERRGVTLGQVMNEKAMRGEVRL